MVRACPELAEIVGASSSRADAVAARARILALLLEMRVPLGGGLRKPWYVHGAVARCGAQGLLRAWNGSPVPPPSIRRFRDHLGALEDVYAIVQQPGDPVPTRNRKPTQYGPGGAGARKLRRYPDTIHVLTETRDREWWQSAGPAVRRLHPEIRTDPRAWRKWIGDWRTRKPVQRLLWDMGEALGRQDKRKPTDDRGRNLEASERLAHLARSFPSHEQLLEELRRVGAEVRGRAGFELLGNPERARAAIALLSLALRRVTPPTNWGGFLVHAVRRATEVELSAASREVLGS